MQNLKEIKGLKNNDQLAEFLGISLKYLDHLLKEEKVCVEKKSLDDENKDNPFVDFAYFYLYTKKGKKRKIYETINQGSKTALQSIRKFLENNYNPLECVHGFVKGKGIRTNALNHIGKKIVINLDVKNFFESIKINQVKEVFLMLGANEDIASGLAKISTIENFLPQGFYTSPILSNMVFMNIDKELSKHSKEKIYTYTRYGDDMTFSSNDNIDLGFICSIIRKNGFVLNDNKTKFMKRGRSQIVTGLSVSDHEMPRIPKKIKKLLRMHFYFLDKLGEDEYSSNFYQTSKPLHTYLIWLEGWCNYLNSVEPFLARKYFPIIEREKQLQKEVRSEDINIMNLKL
ncbi:MAG: reverse transcriptase family protein [Candidatus Pacebacteria bacterium]|nr:reverse transcriptase family protein [Candidatus Paceibacterota bacterium]